MKKILMKKIFILILGIIACLSVFCGCNKGSVEPEMPKFEALNIKQTSVTLDVYEQAKLQCVLTNVSGTITWEIADSTVAIVNDKGEVSALTNGSTVVTASVGEYSDTCIVNVVSSGSVPSLFIDNGELELALGDKFLLSGKVTYKGNLCEDATCSYEVLQGEQVVIVSENGEISAIGYGDALVLVTASWRGANGQTLASMKQSVTITVKSVVQFELEKEEIALYTIQSLGDKSYENTANLNLTVYEDGKILDSENIVWSVVDQSGVVSIEENVVKGQKEGVTKVKYTATLSDGNTLEGFVSIEVKLPSIEDTSITVYLEKCELKIIDDNGAYAWTNKENVIFAKDIFGQDSNDVIEKILDKDGNVIGESSKITKMDTLSSTPNTKTTIGVSNGKYIKVVNAIVADHIIDSEVKLATHLPLIKDGYVILVKNLDFSEWKPWGSNYNEYIYQEGMYCAWRGKSYPQGKSVDSRYATVNSTPFKGHFDGMGYSIKNLSLGTSGLFGYIQEATLENFGLEVTKVYNTSIPTGLIARQANISTLITIKNVYVKFDLKNKQSHETSGKLGIITGATNENISVENCIFDIYDSGATEQSINNFGLVSVAFEHQHFKFKNTYFVFNGDGTKTLKYQTSGVVNEDINNLLANKVFSTRLAFEEYVKTTQGAKEGFNYCWSLSEDIPLFKN